MLRYIKLDIYFNKDNNKAPYFIGSTIRGVFGHALKKVSCINPSNKCDGCFAANCCLYYEFYEIKNSSHNFRFDIQLGTHSWDFSLYLYQNACDKLPYIISALNMAVSNFEFLNTKLSLKAIAANGMLVYDGKEFNLKDISPMQPIFEVLPSTIEINIKTPLRLKSNGTFIKPEDITPKTIIYSIQNRYNELIQQNTAANIENLPTQLLAELEFADLERYSNRQKTKMGFGGYMGKLLYGNVCEEAGKILQIGKIISVGKSVVFGLGKIELIKRCIDDI